MKHKLLHSLLISGLLLASAQVIGAPEEGERSQTVANVFYDNTVLAFEFKDKFQRATVKVTGPRFFRANMYQEKGNPAIDLSKFGKLDDGLYRYQILVASAKTIELRSNRLYSGRDLKSRRNNITKTETQSGSFWIKDGSIVIPSNITEEKVK